MTVPNQWQKEYGVTADKMVAAARAQLAWERTA